MRRRLALFGGDGLHPGLLAFLVAEAVFLGLIRRDDSETRRAEEPRFEVGDSTALLVAQALSEHEPRT